MPRDRFIPKVSQGRTRILGFRIDGSAVAESAGTGGILEGAYDATIAKNAGDNNEFTITFKHPFSRAPVVVATPAVADCELQIKSVTKTAVVIESFESDGVTVEADADFHVIIMGFDAAAQD